MTPAKRRLAVLYGGDSLEREVSLVSGNLVSDELEGLFYEVQRICLDSAPLPTLSTLRVDAAVVMLHGGWGENGTIQRCLELLKIPYSGCSALSCALAMHKAIAKSIFVQAGVPTPPWRTVTGAEDIESAIASVGGFPCVIKPCSEGSSVGLRLWKDKDALYDATELFKCFGELLVERFIAGMILTVPVIDVPGHFQVLAPLQVVPLRSEMYDEVAKSEGLREYILTPDLGEATLARVKSAALNAHKALRCSGVTRVDMILSTDEPYVLEVNTIPGMGPRGNLITACESQGISRSKLVEFIARSIEYDRRE